MKILIDFDDTLFHTDRFKDDLIKLFEKCGVSEADFNQYYYDYSPNKNEGLKIKTYFVDKHIKRLGEELNINQEKLKSNVEKFFSDTSSYVFPDVISFLKEFDKNDLYIISFGGKELLRLKIGNSGLANYVKEVILTERLKEFVVGDLIKRKKWSDNDAIFFLDDRIEQLESIKSLNVKIKTILIKRSEGRYDDDPNGYCDFVAKNLKEVKKIIIKNKTKK